MGESPDATMSEAKMGGSKENGATEDFALLQTVPVALLPLSFFATIDNDSTRFITG